MGFKHDELLFDHNDTMTCHLACQHIGQVNYGSQFPMAAHGRISEKQDFPDGLRPGSNLEFENMATVTSNDNSGSAFDNNGETVRSENNKRPVDVEESLQIAAKCRRLTVADDEFKSRKDAAISESSGDSHGNSSGFPQYICNKSEDRRLSLYPGYYEDHNLARYNRAEADSSLSAFNYIPRKTVAIGLDHQADIPSWRPKSFRNCRRDDGPDASTSSGGILNVQNSCKLGCHCFDKCSVRCVRQHVMEAREQLRSSLGHGRFLELGLWEMGEDVALVWTEEEEELFDGVVASNPASAGKNFWYHLPHAFPSKSSKELVSYYFNVFMLRRRAEQNRSGPLNVDSDDDEWLQETEEDDEDEYEDDSGVESPTDYVEVNMHEDEDAEEGECDDEEEYGTDGYNLADSKSKCDTGDVHDDSCTSYEGHHNVHDVLDHGSLLHAEYRNDGISGMSDHDFFVGHYDLKPWDLSYIGGLDKELDLFPTCVIEEVFRSESWENS